MTDRSPYTTGFAAGVVLMAVLIAAWATGYDQGVRDAKAECARASKGPVGGGQ